MLTKIKLALRISHNKLDGEINDNIAFAKQEMERLGIDTSKTVTEGEIVVMDPLIYNAIKTYCQYAFTTDLKAQEGYFASWSYQLDCLRKTEAYRVVI